MLSAASRPSISFGAVFSASKNGARSAASAAASCTGHSPANAGSAGRAMSRDSRRRIGKV